MGKKVQSIEIPHQGGPPPYFTSDFEYPLNYPAPYAPPLSVQPQAGYPGAPYNQPPAYPNNVAHPGQYYPQNSYHPMAQIPHDPLQVALAMHEKLYFRTNQTLGFRNKSLIVQIRGVENQIVLSTLMTTITLSTGHHSSDDHHRNTISRSTITFTEPGGRNLMTCQQAKNEFSVTTGDRTLGIIRGAPMGISCCGSNLSAENSNGETYFEIVKNGSSYLFVKNGTTIATARRGVLIGDDEFGVEFPAFLDPSTKAMIIAVSYYLFVLYFAETTCGCSGSSSLAKCTLIPGMIFITIFIGMAIFIAIKIKQSTSASQEFQNHWENHKRDFTKFPSVSWDQFHNRGQ